MRTPPSQAPLSEGSTTTLSQGGHSPISETAANTQAIPSSALFSDRREITISHEGALYRLRITRQGKLILNK
ncbi:hemin uptake protein HemP [Hoeflea alexandrii]|uniref:hemin uptake protein HemP n=1 Tax=Hoeflea alexandrii TaxID=288436 RepID=UPI0022AFDE52|nr:hemin uptake protein HemP [Hoeflea alexandrii]MCZ4291774.1 hemin uptake protein HemP [Hoeflea alexandrii]